MHTFDLSVSVKMLESTSIHVLSDRSLITDITRHYKHPPVDQIALLFKPHKMRNK